jgi:hypothetical protein
MFSDKTDHPLGADALLAATAMHLGCSLVDRRQFNRQSEDPVSRHRARCLTTNSPWVEAARRGINDRSVDKSYRQRRCQ